jgi:hypothetical protein
VIAWRRPPAFRASSRPCVQGHARRELIAGRTRLPSIPRLLSIAAAAVVLALPLAGCGGGSSKDDNKPATATDRTALQQVVADFINAYERADGRTICGLLTPAARRTFSTQLTTADPGLAGRPCPALITSAAFGDPSDQPPAIAEASKFTFRHITTAAHTATLTFTDGRSWHLVKSGNHWLITDLPLIPPSLDAHGTT